MISDSDILANANRLISKVGLDVCLFVRKRKSEKNFLFVEKINESFCLSYSNKFFSYSPVTRRAFLLHECFHVIQYLEKFPMLLSPNKRGSIFLVQNIITDLYVSKGMREAGFISEARNIFNIQLKNMKRLLQSKSSKEKILRLSLLLSEATLFEEYSNQIFNKLKNKLTPKEQKNVENISSIMMQKYLNGDIFGMYKAIIELLFTASSLCFFDNMIIVQEKKCLK